MNYPGRTIDPLSWAMKGHKRAGDNEEAAKMLDSLRAVWSEARARLVAEREKQAKYANQQRRPVSYTVGQMVYLSSRNLSTVKGKLKERWSGPFIVKAVEGNGSAVTLDLPATWKLHPTFHVDLVKPYVTSQYQWPGRAQQDRVVPTIVDGEVEWEVESIIGKYVERTTKKERREVVGESTSRRAGLRSRKRWETVPVTTDTTYYLVKWKGYDEVEASWKDANGLSNCRELIDEYESIRAQQGDAGGDEDNEGVELAVAWAMVPRVDGQGDRMRG
jgi:hypothetical protein